MQRSRTTSAYWMRGVADALASRGLDVPALFAQAGLDMWALQHSGRRYPTERIARLWEQAATCSGDPAIGLARPGVPQPGNFDVVGYAMMSAPTLRAALLRLVRYLRIVSDAAVVSLHEQPDCGWIRLELFSGDRPTPRQRYDYDLAALLAFLSWIAGRELRPCAAGMTHAAPADRAPYQAAFRCAVRFAAPFNGLCLTAADLDWPLPAGNAELSEVHERLAGAWLQRLQGNCMAARAQELLARQLPGGEPRRARIAGLLAMSDHTFQRRLAAEGTNFSALVDTTRRDLAQHYLAQPQVPIAQVAYLLGFADQSNFFRACLRWFDRAPGRYRQQMLHGG